MYYDFKEFNKEEYEDRVNKLKWIMQNENLDAVILTEEENIRWISGYWVFTIQDKCMPTAVIIPRKDNKEPVLLIVEEATGVGLSWIKNTKFWEEGLDSYLHVANGKILLDTLRELDLEHSMVGIENGNGMRINLDLKDVDYLRDGLKNTDFIDVSSRIWKLRSIKSPCEIDKIRKASTITNNSLIEGFGILKEGLTERELGQYFVKNWFENGATGISHVGVGFGRHALDYAHCDPKEYPLKTGELVKVDIGCSFEGYRCDMYRMACIGKPDKEESKIASIIKSANKEIIKNIKEGVKCSDLYNIAARIFEDNDLEYLLSTTAYIGHGIGLSIHEPPYIYKDNNTTLKAGMTLTVEPWTFDRGNHSICMNIEDVVLVRKDDCGVMTDMERGIFLI